ncbi:MAG: Spy/CpxP family protein refolding chaperone [Bryobacteraceae bacterium]
MKMTILKTALLVSALGGFALAQPPDAAPQAAPAPPAAPVAPRAPHPPQPPHGMMMPGCGMAMPGHDMPMPEHSMMMPGPAGKWWDNPDLAKRLNLTGEQQKKMDEVFQQNRLRMIDLHAALEKEEATLDPLIEAANPDDSKVLPQIDRVAQARAELEKANARLLLGLRHVLTPEQWKTLDSDRHGAHGPDGHGGPEGHGGPSGHGAPHPPQPPERE